MTHPPIVREPSPTVQQPSMLEDELVEPRVESNRSSLPRPGEVRPAVDYMVPQDIEFRRAKGGKAPGTASGRRRRVLDVPMLEVKYIPAPGLERIADVLIAHDPKLEHLQKRIIHYWWRRKGGSNKGATKLGECVLPSNLVELYAPDVDYIIWLAADHMRDGGYTRPEIEEELYHELLHTADEEDTDEPLPITLPHDYEGFADAIRRYGLPRNAQGIGNAVRQLPLQMTEPRQDAAAERAASYLGTPLLRYPGETG